MTKVIQLIYTQERAGLGKEGDPLRMLTCLHTLDGKLVAHEFTEYDGTNLKEFYPENLGNI